MLVGGSRIYGQLRCSCERIGVLSLSSLFFSSRRRHTRLQGDWSSDVCSSDLTAGIDVLLEREARLPDVHTPERKVFCNEIGRASCRERVEGLVLDGPEKKKKNLK